MQPSINALEANSQYAFIRRWRKLAQTIEWIRGLNPPKLIESGWTDTSFDGSIGPMHEYKIYYDPAEKQIRDLLKREEEEIGMGTDLLGISE